MQYISVRILYLCQAACAVISIAVSCTVVIACIIRFRQHLLCHVSVGIIESALGAAVCVMNADAVSILIILILGAVSVFAFFCIAYRVDLTRLFRMSFFILFKNTTHLA